jgi:hypothetical protein
MQFSIYFTQNTNTCFCVQHFLDDKNEMIEK